MGAAGCLMLSVKDRKESFRLSPGAFLLIEGLHARRVAGITRHSNSGARICKESMMNTIPEHIKAPLRRLIDGGLPVDEIAIMMQLSEKAVKREIERIGAGD